MYSLIQQKTSTISSPPINATNTIIAPNANPWTSPVMLNCGLCNVSSVAKTT